ncbi:MAG: hypothetical protein M3331_06240 [Actinomycetota bacterium]|nr:hypothetical protein [Actinomycetota bacterium]
MLRLSIRCHPCVPVAADQLEQWLSCQVAELRSDVPHGTVRLSRLTQHLPSSDVPIGWLLELELFEADSDRVHLRILDALRDMRLLGLQLTVMAPVDWSGYRPSGRWKRRDGVSPGPAAA